MTPGCGCGCGDAVPWSLLLNHHERHKNKSQLLTSEIWQPARYLFCSGPSAVLFGNMHDFPDVVASLVGSGVKRTMVRGLEPRINPSKDE